jgi:hypothetical protein
LFATHDATSKLGNSGETQTPYRRWRTLRDRRGRRGRSIRRFPCTGFYARGLTRNYLVSWSAPAGTTISIKAVDAGGKLDASYANPSPLPFYSAIATSDNSAIKLLFELRAGGYDGSTYTLSYDAGSDRLTGVYYQAVAKQEFEVVFVRAKS